MEIPATKLKSQGNCPICGLNTGKDITGAINIAFPNRPKVSFKNFVKIFKRKANARGVQFAVEVYNL